MMGTDLSDAELLRETRQHPDAFVTFYERYERVVIAYFKRQVRDPEVVADLTAEVFAAVLRAAPKYRPLRPSAANWLFTIARNTLRRSVRKQRVEARARAQLGIREAAILEDHELERIAEVASTDASLVALLDDLPRSQADAIRAHILDDRSYPEIARELRTSELVIRKRVSRGLTTLRTKVEKEERA